MLNCEPLSQENLSWVPWLHWAREGLHGVSGAPANICGMNAWMNTPWWFSLKHSDMGREKKVVRERESTLGFYRQRDLEGKKSGNKNRVPLSYSYPITWHHVGIWWDFTATWHLRGSQKLNQETMWSNALIFIADRETKVRQRKTMLLISHT